jgi:predicted LPLAT superfamily acyltransferase
MSPDDRPGQVSQRTSEIVRAVVAAHQHDDRLQVAFEIVASAMLVVDGDADMQTSLAWLMRRCAARLDHYASGEPTTWQ